MMQVADVDLDELWACASPEALRRTVDLSRRALRAPVAVITSFTERDQIIRCLSDGAEHLNLSGLLCREVVDTGRPLVLPALPRDARHARIMRDVPINAYIGVPIRLSNARDIGTLCVLSDESQAWTDDDLALVTDLAALLAGQIELKHEAAHQQHVEETLNATKARLLAVADRIPGLVFERRKIDARRSSYTFFGSTKTTLPAIRELMEFGSAASLTFIHREDREFVRAALLRSQLEETDVDLIFRVKDIDRSIRWLRSQSIVRRADDGTVSWDGVCFDITDLIAAKEAAEQARAAKETLLVNVNHELRAPLQAIIGYSDFLRDEKRTDLIATHAKNIQAAASSLLAIVNQLLAQARGDNPEPALSKVDLKAFCQSCLDLVAPAAMEKFLSVRFEMDENAPLSALLDRQMMQQVLLNLLNNAVKFTKVGSVTLRLERVPKGLRFSVVDTGVGIPDDKRDQLFKRFSRLVSGDRPVEGSGLGLSIAKSLVEAMDGEIGIERHIERGTTFWLEVPLRVEVPPHAAAHIEDVPFDPTRTRILLADDLDLNRRLIADMLSIDGYIVDSVADGTDAVAAVLQRHYDLVLMDMIMPGMDGLAATRAIRALPYPVCDVPIVALTANSFAEQLDACLQAGMNATLVKPMSVEALTAAVSMWARGRTKAA